MPASFFFYDLETSGFDPRRNRIMQFAGQRTNLELQPIGEPVDYYIKLTPDVLPDPEAVLVTGITPQQTISEGVSEFELLKYFTSDFMEPGTIYVGYNNVRFDDEFMRFTLYRNFYDAYEWEWKDNRSRWDLLDVVRMTRALRPEGIKWPYATNGKPSNSLELMTAINQIDHHGAHNALADVRATIAVARLIKTKQPKLFSYLLKIRDKREVAPIVKSGLPFVYTSGKYSSQFEKTTVVSSLCDHPIKQGALVYDLRHDPSVFAKMSPKELAARWVYSRDENAPPRLPVKTLQFNRCPAVAPLKVLDKISQERLQIDINQIEANLKTLAAYTDFVPNLLKAVELLDKKQQAELITSEQYVDGQLYDGFINNNDKQTLRLVRETEPENINEGLVEKFTDSRLKALLPLYKARNFPESLNNSERKEWDKYCADLLTSSGLNSRLAKYFDKLRQLSESPGLSKHKRYIIEELRLYGESIMPSHI
jgi:exodeoxyribonuclease I